MKNKSKYLLILLTIIIVSFPSICFSKPKTIQGEYCMVYTGDMNNKDELKKFTDSLRMKSIENGIVKSKTDWRRPEDCDITHIMDVIDNYMKIKVISNTKVGRRMCEKVKITLDQDIINQYFKELDRDLEPKRRIQKINEELEGKIRTRRLQEIDNSTKNCEWCWDLSVSLHKISLQDKKDITVGIILDVKINNLDERSRESVENREENLFYDQIEWNNIIELGEKYKVVERKHLKKILDEQKLSSSGITDSETFKLGKILNLDIVVLRMIYDNSQVTKVLKVDTGEVLLSKSYYENILPFNVSSSSIKENYKFQEECGKRCEEVFKNKYGGVGQVTINTENGFMVINQRNHYNYKLNKCFHLVKTDYCNKKNVVEYSIKELSDVNENRTFGESLYFFDTKHFSHCYVGNKDCKSEREWNLLIKPYMEE
ncbi:MAG: hypothetical protein NT140_05850 [Deltaproteobacteria bacterium]|nr:hypothetical protein [Deltaproteobacteria bacterium]